MNINQITTLASRAGYIIRPDQDQRLIDLITIAYQAGIETEREACIDLCENMKVNTNLYTNEEIPAWECGTMDAATAIRHRRTIPPESDLIINHRDALLKIRETLLRVYKLCPRERESNIMASIDEIDVMLHPLTWASWCAPVNTRKETL